MTFDELSNALFGFSLRRLGAELQGGSQPPTPPHQVVENPEAHQGAGYEGYPEVRKIQRRATRLILVLFSVQLQCSCFSMSLHHAPFFVNVTSLINQQNRCVGGDSWCHKALSDSWWCSPFRAPTSCFLVAMETRANVRVKQSCYPAPNSPPDTSLSPIPWIS